MHYKSSQQRIQFFTKAHCPKKALDWLQDRDRRHTERAEAACAALRAMGEPAQSAIPSLTAMLRDKNNYEAARRALLVLLHLGKPGLEPMLVGLRNEKPQTRAQTLYTILWADTGFAKICRHSWLHPPARHTRFHRLFGPLRCAV